MTREQIIAACKAGAQRAASVGFAMTPVQKKHIARLQFLKARAEADEKHNDMALAHPEKLRA